MCSPRRLIGPLRFLFASGVLALLVGGCPQQPVDPESPDTADNSSLATASVLRFDANETIRFEGEISSTADIDVYRLGKLDRGDRVFADVKAIAARLDLVAAVFDVDENIHIFNDDRAADASDLNPLVDFVIRGRDGDYFLGVQALNGTTGTGRYQVEVRITHGVGVPDPRPQIVFLEWRGGSGLSVPNVGVFNLPPFDATQVGLNSSDTAALKQRVAAIVKDRYAGFNLLVQNSDDHATPGGPHSTIFFGSNSATAFAISEQIDSYNVDQSDNAIVFTGSFRDAFAASRPNFEELAQALGNTTAHEVGHLLGLVHTKNCNELMDTTCGNARILQPQVFGAAPLDDSVFGFGFQNPAELLTWILGLVGG
ncbi:MAG: hypothetical protein IPM64_09640 [Phycisphaerales bacterium]|nr:hypothetical protein [Phycisphaerales bacterium]